MPSQRRLWSGPHPPTPSTATKANAERYRCTAPFVCLLRCLRLPARSLFRLCSRRRPRASAKRADPGTHPEIRGFGVVSFRMARPVGPPVLTLSEVPGVTEYSECRLGGGYYFFVGKLQEHKVGFMFLQNCLLFWGTSPRRDGVVPSVIVRSQASTSPRTTLTGQKILFKMTQFLGQGVGLKKVPHKLAGDQILCGKS